MGVLGRVPSRCCRLPRSLPQVPEELPGSPGQDPEVAVRALRWDTLLLRMWTQHGVALPTSCLSVRQNADVVPETQHRLRAAASTVLSGHNWLLRETLPRMRNSVHVALYPSVPPSLTNQAFVGRSCFLRSPRCCLVTQYRARTHSRLHTLTCTSSAPASPR